MEEQGNNENRDQTLSIQNEINLKNRMKSGLNWFYWIAGLSVINAILAIAGVNLVFIAGLGLTHVIEGLFLGFAKEVGIIGISYVGRIFSLLFIAGFVLLGKFGRKSNALIILGIVVYGLDSLVFLFAKDWFSFGFHIFAIVGIVMGYRAKSKLEELHAANQPEFSTPTLNGDEIDLKKER